MSEEDPTGKVEKRGRPKGVRYDRTLHIRVPRDMQTILRRLSAEAKVTTGDLVRRGLWLLLTHEGIRWRKLVDDPKTPSTKKLHAVRTARLAQKAILACTEEGVKIARARAKVGKATRNELINTFCATVTADRNQKEASAGAMGHS